MRRDPSSPADFPRGIEDGWIPVNQITPSPVNPRRDFDPGALAELAESMGTHGLLQPVVVRSLPGGGHSLLAGERRWRAAQLLGWDAIPARVRVADSDADAITLMLTENLQRENLNPMEEAEAFQRLRDLGMKQSEIAKKVGRSQPRIAHSLKLRMLPEAVREQIAKGELSFAHGRALCRFVDRPGLAIRIAALAVAHGASAKEIDIPLPFAEQLAAEGLVEVPLAEAGWGIEECRAACARLPHRRLPPEHLLAWIAAALPPGQKAEGSGQKADGDEASSGLPSAFCLLPSPHPLPSAPESIWDAAGQESPPELDLSGLDAGAYVDPLTAPVSLSLLALVLLTVFTALLWWH